MTQNIHVKCMKKMLFKLSTLNKLNIGVALPSAEYHTHGAKIYYTELAPKKLEAVSFTKEKITQHCSGLPLAQ